MVEDFWVEVVKPFRSWALHNLDPSHLLGTAMCLNWGGAKIPDYGVWEHIAFACAPFDSLGFMVPSLCCRELGVVVYYGKCTCQ